jgi:two-component system response regulator YesN
MRKVVVVEDEELVRKGIVLTVDWAALGCAVAGEAANGEEGLALIRALQPDLVVTDIRMPRMDGIEMLRTLRQEGSRCCVILLTAYSDFHYAQAALKLGAADYLLKPFEDGELEAAVQRVLPRAADASPELPPLAPLAESTEAQSKYTQEIVRYIAAHYGEELTLAQLAGALDVSESHLSHIFKKETGQTLNGYLTSYRIRQAMQLLGDCRNRVSEVAERVGYRDVTYFSATFKKITGLSPSEYQKRAGQ